jgi:hypothetical protein
MDKYLSNRNYLALYIHSVAMRFSSALVLSFVGANFFTQGLALNYILLYFGLEFILRGILSPLSSTSVSKIGLKKTILLANFLLMFYFLSLGFYSLNPKLFFFSFILHSISKALYHPAKHFLEASLVENRTRGHFLTMEIILNSITAATALSIATFSVTVLGSFMPVAVVSIIMLAIASYAVVDMLPNIKTKDNLCHGYKAIIKNVFSKHFRKDVIAFSGFGASMGFHDVVVSLVVFFSLGSLKEFGIITSILFIVNMFLILAFGKLIDHRRKRSTHIASVMELLSLVGLFASSGVFGTILAKSFYDVSWESYDASFTARFHQKMKKAGFQFACSKEVALSMATGVFCLILSLITSLQGEQSLVPASFVLVSIGAILAIRYFKD